MSGVKEQGRKRRKICGEIRTQPELRESGREMKTEKKKRKKGTGGDKIILSQDKSSHQDRSFKEQETLSWERAINLFLIFRGKFSP